jgi:P27 family predicted phage terminase small subunit
MTGSRGPMNQFPRHARGATNNAPAPIPEPPPELTETGAIFWRENAAGLVQRELLTDETIPGYTELCRTFEALTLTRATIKSEGRSIRDESGKPHRHPLLTTEKQLADRLLSYLRDFGMTGASRKRLGNQELWLDDEDPFA